MKIWNVDVWGLNESVRASKFPMATDANKCTSDITGTTFNLASSQQGSGHDCFLKGIVVQFDLTASEKMWPQIERYHFLDIVSSMSTMHRIMSLDVRKQCNEYVTEEAIQNLIKLIDAYSKDKTHENRLRVLYNIPSGYELTARCTTNYLQLKTIYFQRRNHELDEWKTFCNWIETLPMFDELVLRRKNNS